MGSQILKDTTYCGEFLNCNLQISNNLMLVISGLLTPIGKTSREALISREPTKFVVKICVNLRYISSSEFGSQ
jgi:hypothetical protein